MSPISTTVLNTLDTSVKLLFLLFLKVRESFDWYKNYPFSSAECNTFVILALNLTNQNEFCTDEQWKLDILRQKIK